MEIMTSWLVSAGLALLAGSLPSGAELPQGPPAVSVDLTTSDGVASVSGEWRYSDARLVEVDFRGPGPDGQPTGAPVRTWDIEPHAGAAGFDDSGWERIAPESVSERRGTGRLGFNWYRLRLTLPEWIDGVPVAGATVVFQTAVDDYAEVWVDGDLPRRLGQSGGPVVGGFNAPNRLVVARDARPGQQVQIAVFGINGPLSSPPTNFIWMREARLDVYPVGPGAVAPHEVSVEIVRLDPRLDAIVPPNPKIHALATGFQFTEGPVWDPASSSLLFSDPNANRIYRWTEGRHLEVFRDRSGYQGADVAEYHQPGSNGLARDLQGRLVIAEHGNRRISRLESDGRLSVLAERYQGHRLNSPNDLVFRSDGSLYFTDPPFGLPRTYADPRKELAWSGVFRLAPDGTLTLLTNELRGPNGIAFSPDESFLYVADWDTDHKVVMRYPVRADGSIGPGHAFADLGDVEGEEALDGVKVDERGDVFVSGPGGVWVFAPDGTRLGAIRAPQLPANLAWGDADGRTLYLTARSALYRMRLAVAGAGRRGAPDGPGVGIDVQTKETSR